MHTLDVPGVGHSAVDFADGVAIAHALHHMCEEVNTLASLALRATSYLLTEVNHPPCLLSVPPLYLLTTQWVRFVCIRLDGVPVRLACTRITATS
jgi:hypothetical protein